jgi:hypothetical protein
VFELADVGDERATPHRFRHTLRGSCWRGVCQLRMSRIC